MVEIGKGKKKRNVPQRYVPKSLTDKDRKAQEKSILKGTDRPKVDSFKSKRSGWAKKFEDKYGYKVTETAKINKSLKRERAKRNYSKRSSSILYEWVKTKSNSVQLGVR